MSPVGMSEGEGEMSGRSRVIIMSASPCGEDFIFHGKALKGKQQ